MSYYVYILQCSDTTLYTGITTDPTRRLHEHNHTKRGAKYTSARRPVSMPYTEKAVDKSSALKREYILRQLSRLAKLDLIAKDDKIV